MSLDILKPDRWDFRDLAEDSESSIHIGNAYRIVAYIVSIGGSVAGLLAPHLNEGPRSYGLTTICLGGILLLTLLERRGNTAIANKLVQSLELAERKKGILAAREILYEFPETQMLMNQYVTYRQE